MQVVQCSIQDRFLEQGGNRGGAELNRSHSYVSNYELESGLWSAKVMRVALLTVIQPLIIIELTIAVG